MKKAKALQELKCEAVKIKTGDVLIKKDDGYTPEGAIYGIGTFFVENNPHIFECPYEEKLTSDQWDEKARGYGYWIPRDGKRFYFYRPYIQECYSSVWYDNDFDIALLRAGLAFETREEAVKMLKKLKKEKQL